MPIKKFNDKRDGSQEELKRYRDLSPYEKQRFLYEEKGLTRNDIYKILKENNERVSRKEVQFNLRKFDKDRHLDAQRFDRDVARARLKEHNRQYGSRAFRLYSHILANRKSGKLQRYGTPTDEETEEIGKLRIFRGSP